MQEIFLDEPIRSYKKDEEYKILQRNMEFSGQIKGFWYLPAWQQAKEKFSFDFVGSIFGEGRKESAVSGWGSA